MKTILVADDSADFRELITEVLQDAGYRVVAACDGEEAWGLLQRESVDALVLDLNMPRLDGLELTRRVRGDGRFAGQPILMLTVRDLVEDQLAGYDRGADDYLTKPFDHGVLAARVKALLRRTA